MRITLRRHKDKALLRGYPWVFANQIHRTEGEPVSGDVVEIAASDGRLVGRGLYHADSLIAVRFLTSDLETPIDAAFFRARLQRALDFRRRLLPEATHARLVFGESDGLPGTTIDRYGDVLTWTTLSYGMAQRRDLLLDALEELASPRAIVERNDAWLRGKDGLDEATGVLRGTYDGPVEIEEHGVRYAVDVLEGPKTGFFIDQRFHRAFIRRLSAGARVLDVFCADGGFGLQAAHAGAERVHMIDVSDAALARARRNVDLNGLGDRVELEQADALDRIGGLVEEGAQYDLVVLDPPSFAQSRRHVPQAERAYQRLNISGLQLLPPGGLLATASCSQAVDEDAFLKIVQYSARKTGSNLRLLYRGTQPPDHPVLEAMPETHYLKFYVFQKLGDEAPIAPDA